MESRNQVTTTRDMIGWSSVLAVGVLAAIAAVARADTLEWTGKDGANNNANWTTAANVKNWFSPANAAAAPFADTVDEVQFLDNPAGPSAITIIAAGVTPTGVFFNNTATNYSFTGGSINGATDLIKNGTGMLTLSSPNAYTGTTRMIGGTIEVGDNAAFGTSVLSLQGSTTIQATQNNPTIANEFKVANTSNLTLGGAKDIVFTGKGTLNRDLTLTVPLNRKLTLRGDIGEGGVPRKIIKDGAGTAVLSGKNTFSGGTQIKAGKLIDGTLAGSATGGGDVAVNASGTFGGIGTITGAVSVDNFGAIEPGIDAPGELASATLTLSNNSVLNYDLDQANVVGAVGGNDLYTANGDLTLGGLLRVFEGPSFGDGIYRLLNYTGTFTNNGLAVASLYGGRTGIIDTSIPGQVNLVVVPEPATVFLLALGGMLMAQRRRR